MNALSRELLTLTPIAWRSLWRNTRRTLLMMLTVAVGVWSIVSFNALLHAWMQSSLDNSLRELTGEVQVHAPGYLDDPGVAQRMPAPTAALNAVLGSSAVRTWSARVRVPAVVRSERSSSPVTLVGIDAAREQGLSFIADPMAQGRTLESVDDDGILVGRALLDRLRTGFGKRIVLMSEGADGQIVERGFRIVGVFASASHTEQAFVFVGRHAAQQMLGIGDGISEIALDLNDPAQLTATIDHLRAAAPGADVRSWRELRPLLLAMSRLSSSFVGIWLFIMSVLISFGVVNSLMMTVYERIREFGLLQALGLRPRLIVLEVLIESALLIGFGVLLGATAAAMTIGYFHGGLDLGFLARGAEWLGVGRILYPHLDLAAMIGNSLLVWTLGIAASLWPAWRASRYSPIESLGKT